MRLLIWSCVTVFFLAIVRLIWRTARAQQTVADYLEKHPPAIEPEELKDLPAPPVYNIQINYQHHEHNNYIIVSETGEKKKAPKF